MYYRIVKRKGETQGPLTDSDNEATADDQWRRVLLTLHEQRRVMQDLHASATSTYTLKCYECHR